MKKTSILALFGILLFASMGLSHLAKAQMMGGYFQSATSTSGQLDAEEAAGQAIAQKLQAKTLTCSNLSQSDFESLGEYYMNLMMGSGHDAMDNYIVSRYGQSYDDQMHVAMGERFSGCKVNAEFPGGMMGFGPMMGVFGMMEGWGGNGSNTAGYWMGGLPGFGMMGFGYPYGGFGLGLGSLIFSTIVWVLAIIGLIAAIRWVIKKK